jgi:uncharacterized damage-inducible protein DinB
MKKNRLAVEALPGYQPEIGRWVWCLEDVRRTILKRITGLSQEVLDKRLNGGHSIGQLLYHIAFIEADWVYEEVLEGKWNPDIRSLFPEQDRNVDNTLTHIQGQSINEHLHRLNAVRKELLYHFRSMNLDDWRRSRSLEYYDVTPEWVIYHLIEHESHHRGQIFQMLRTFKDEFV